MYKVIISDLDGTLLNLSHEISNFTKEIIKLINKSNIYFIIATGRHNLDVVNICKKNDIKAYYISSNGSVAFDDNNRLLFNFILNKNVVKEIINYIYMDENITTNIFSLESWVTNSKANFNRDYVKKYSYKELLDNELFLSNVCKIHFNSKNINLLSELKENLINNWNKYIDVNFSLPFCLELNPKNVSKGNTLKKVIEKLKLNISDCISFGDGMNDFDMLSLTGKGCIMKNACDELKNKLFNLEIIDSNENDGVAKYLKDNILSKLV